MKKIIWGILILSFLLAASWVSAETVYQENANSTDCAGDFIALNPCSNAYDGNWDTFAVATYKGAVIYFNYSKPAHSSSAVWQVGDNDPYYGGRLVITNLSIPSSCFNADANLLMLEANVWTSNGDDVYVDWQCYNGTGLELLVEHRYFACQIVYEEGIYWEITEPAGCTSDAECDDADACTTDTCDSATGECANTALSCDDGNACTEDSCDALLGCQHSPIVYCCNSDSDCEALDVCTAYTCVNHGCTKTPIANCCRSDADCNDDNACTTDACGVDNKCAYTPINAYCGFCMKCSAGACVNQAYGQDLKDECTPYNVCLNNWTINKTFGGCDGNGACRAQLVTVSIGNVCYNGQNVNPNANANCDVWSNCVAGRTTAAQYWVGYNLGPTCTDTGWIATGGQWSATPHYMISVSEHAPVCQEINRQCIDNSECELCQKCVNSQCVNQNSGQDLKDECNPYNVCLNNWTINKTLGTCDGSGACRTQTVNVGAGNVCINGQNVNPTADVHCGNLLYNCIEGRRIAYQYYLGYAGDGTPTCTSTGWIKTGVNYTAPKGYVISPTEQAVSCSIIHI